MCARGVCLFRAFLAKMTAHWFFRLCKMSARKWCTQTHTSKTAVKHHHHIKPNLAHATVKCNTYGIHLKNNVVGFPAITIFGNVLIAWNGESTLHVCLKLLSFNYKNNFGFNFIFMLDIIANYAYFL